MLDWNLSAEQLSSFRVFRVDSRRHLMDTNMSDCAISLDEREA